MMIDSCLFSVLTSNFLLLAPNSSYETDDYASSLSDAGDVTHTLDIRGEDAAPTGK